MKTKTLRIKTYFVYWRDVLQFVTHDVETIKKFITSNDIYGDRKAYKITTNYNEDILVSDLFENK